MYTTSAKAIVEAKKFFTLNPAGEIPTGMWTQPRWNKADFETWFRKCLHLKTGGQELTEKDFDLQADHRRVKDYKEKRIVTRGRNIFRSKLFAKLYPELHNPENND